MPLRSLTALPVYNEAQHVTQVLDEVLRFGSDVLMVDDGSVDGTSELLKLRNDIHLVRHPINRGYGAGLEAPFNMRCATATRCW